MATYKTTRLVFKNSIHSRSLIKLAKNSKKVMMILIIFMSLILSGCVEYNLGINFHDSNNAEWVQHIRIAENLTSFSSDYLQEWFNVLSRRVSNIGGSTKYISPGELVVKIPFTHGQELEEKLATFYPHSLQTSLHEPINITSNITLKENNFLFLSRNNLIYQLDLRSLAGVVAQKNSSDKTQISLFNIDFTLKTPWGNIKNINSTVKPLPPETNNQQITWQMQLGELNQIEVVFWLPNMLSIGTLIIIIIVLFGYYLKYSSLNIPNQN
ncbi:DUF3153 domain-containing protein [Cylindrospermopsis raciborskii]|jgi:hypothetical protein|uniref:DUF3153 domain-containing protein n=2 Tax=Cylindrospermopsis raciborskii TaxID=77022 RepID=UPI000E1E5EBE|nr:DUF3153 domain-containing protein [Cylindrospermopsis raciborskii]TPX29700.1 DUF3153 domain-containing protein [Cylindrospermopsis raciborskii GIHE 2018]UJL32866.1 DUF3153 domain-containing protein [Cylindrospermopsis raciborskii Cr2010]